MKRYRDETGLPAGTLTLCQVCHYAVRLEVVRMRSLVPGRPYAEYDMWKHTGQSGACSHSVELPRFII